jgi:hypothetical protein
MEHQEENQPAHVPAGMGSVIHLGFSDIFQDTDMTFGHYSNV